MVGAPVTTVDFDFLYRVSPSNEAKLKKVAQALGGQRRQPFPVLSSVYRIVRADTQLQVDLTGQVHGIISFNSFRSKAIRVELEGRILLVAALADIIKIKREANRPQDQAVLHVLQFTLEEQKTAQADKA